MLYLESRGHQNRSFVSLGKNLTEIKAGKEPEEVVAGARTQMALFALPTNTIDLQIRLYEAWHS